MISLRPATAADARLLFDWVNSADSLAGKLQTGKKIDWNEHCEWLRQRLAEPETSIWIADNGKAAVGQVRLQRPAADDSNVVDVDIFVTAEARQRGLAKAMLVDAAGKLAARRPGIRLRARVKKGNGASQKLFASLGYRIVNEEQDHLVFLSEPAIARKVPPGGKSFAKSMALYKRALKTVPLATQTFSKSAMNFVVGASPLFLERGEGCRVWDVDGNGYIDYILGLMPVVLGYRDPDVDQAIVEQLGRGISFSLATELEAALSEKLVELIPSAEMVRFGKNGSDATSAAIRLARAITGRDHVAICGYHGWHDWYIGTTTRDLGVPKAVQALSHTFTFNDSDSLQKALQAAPGKFAAIILEPAGVIEPRAGFLKEVRDLADREGAILIFDEIVCGFRSSLGGAQATYGVTPDLSCFGKAMANGMPISAVVGRRDFMKFMEKIFFSGTFGGETLSLAAARATLGKLERLDVPARLEKLGKRLTSAASESIREHGLSELLEMGGPGWWPRLKLKESKAVDLNILASLLRQETAAAGLLMGSSFNLCLAHDQEAVIEQTVSSLGAAFAAVAAAITDGSPASHLRGEPVQPVFKVRN